MKYGKVLADALEKTSELAAIRAETIRVLEGGISKLRNDLDKARSDLKVTEEKLQASEKKRKRQRKTALFLGIIGLIIGILI
jgi:flagellar motility protein MotE (MotC chaperone)